jgi:hypothetical protein
MVSLADERNVGMDVWCIDPDSKNNNSLCKASLGARMSTKTPQVLAWGRNGALAVKTGESDKWKSCGCGLFDVNKTTIFPELLRKNQNTSHTHNGRCVGQELNPKPHEYKAEALRFQ